MKYCCSNFEHYVIKGTELEYDPQFHAYYLILNHSEHMCTHQELYFCPWCGSKLPQDLGDMWSKILKEEYGIMDPIVKDKDRIPHEFQTDEWWKKRGL